MCSLVSERRVKWTGLDKCVWLYLPWAECWEERYGMCENPPSLLHTSAPTAAHQPLQGPDNFPYLIGHRAECVSETTWCCHQEVPSALWHTRWRNLQEVLCGTDLQQLWHQVPKPLMFFHYLLWLHCFTAANYQACKQHETQSRV